MKRIRPFYLVTALIVVLVLAAGAFFVHMLLVRTAYKQLCLEINDAILSAPPASCTVEQGGAVHQADEELLNCYNQYFLLPRVWPVRQEQVAPDKDSILLHLGDSVLTLTDLGEGDVNLCWQRDGESRGFTFNAGPAAFLKLQSYLRSAEKRP